MIQKNRKFSPIGSGAPKQSPQGQVVLDSFPGSGTTVIAAERTGRRCFGIEIDRRLRHPALAGLHEGEGTAYRDRPRL